MPTNLFHDEQKGPRPCMGKVNRKTEKNKGKKTKDKTKCRVDLSKK